MSNNKYIGLIVALVVCSAAIIINNSAHNAQLHKRMTDIDEKLIEVDGRRNAQYGILKREIGGSCE